MKQTQKKVPLSFIFKGGGKIIGKRGGGLGFFYQITPTPGL